MNTVGSMVVALLASLLVAGFSVVQQDGLGEERFAEKVNLALRRTAHELLTAAGDTTSRILPVQQSGPGTWAVRLGRSLPYDQLPALLQESLKRQGIRAAYDVVVRDCGTRELQLGYASRDLLDGDVPCVGRSHLPGCYLLEVTFATDTRPAVPTMALWMLAGAVALVGSWYVVRRRSTGVPEESTAPVPSTEAESTHFGASRFYPVSLTLVTGEETHTLTYREAKLLGFFLAHPNEVLGRDAILQAVWADEGVTVGRSVDVFVSRLRKLLRPDPAVQIKAIHGVGYRFEVSGEAS